MKRGRTDVDAQQGRRGGHPICVVGSNLAMLQGRCQCNEKEYSVFVAVAA